MAFQRYLIEIGRGVDMHGGDMTNAACKAVKDAMTHCCMAGVQDIFGIGRGSGDIKVHASIFVPEPKDTDIKKLEEILCSYETEIEIKEGGASEKGLAQPEMGTGDHITIALAVLTVYVNI